MIDAIKAFLNGYRAVGIKETRGMEGHGFYATLVKDGKVLGEVADYADGGPLNIHLTNPDDEKALIAYAKEKYPDMQYEPEGCFVGALIDYELAVKRIQAKAKKALLVADETDLDEHGVAKAYSSWKLEPTAENKALVLQNHPQTKFLNDELDQWESIKLPRSRK
jgi:hypothetical protein